MPVAALFGLLAVCLLVPGARRGLGRLGALGVRTVCALGGLAALKALGAGAVGLTLGVNLFNALTVGALGLPGVGLLLMLNWVTQL